MQEGPQHWTTIKEEVAEGFLKYLRRFDRSDRRTILENSREAARLFERMNPAMGAAAPHPGRATRIQRARGARARMGRNTRCNSRPRFNRSLHGGPAARFGIPGEMRQRYAQGLWHQHRGSRGLRTK